MSQSLKWEKFEDSVYTTPKKDQELEGQVPAEKPSDDMPEKLVCRYVNRMDKNAPNKGVPPTPSPDELFFNQIYWTAIADKGFEPNSGKYYWEMAVNTDNFKIGLATEDA